MFLNKKDLTQFDLIPLRRHPLQPGSMNYCQIWYNRRWYIGICNWGVYMPQSYLTLNQGVWNSKMVILFFVGAFSSSASSQVFISHSVLTRLETIMHLLLRCKFYLFKRFPSIFQVYQVFGARKNYMWSYYNMNCALIISSVYSYSFPL